VHDVHRGDVVVFERPDCAIDDAAIKDLIKRVIGLEGDTVEGKDGGVFVNGHRLVEGYLPKGRTTEDFAPVTVPKGNLWVMGDNRILSKDSRKLCNNTTTFIPEGKVVGRAFVQIWPPRGISLL
jgi:signal peptidase I